MSLQLAEIESCLDEPHGFNLELKGSNWAPTMKFEVYCDESRPDLLSSKHPKAEYMLIGSLWLKADDRERYKTDIHALRDTFKIGGEFKWRKVSPSKIAFYESLVDWFCSQKDNLRFRCIAVEQSKLNLQLFHGGDQELGFYKFYYQLLHHWILDFNEYSIFLDFKSNRRRDRLPLLQRCLDRSNLSSAITTVQAVRSRESVLLQLCDVLLGAAAHRLNAGSAISTPKERLTQRLELRLGGPIRATGKAEQKFNVFVIDLQGGW